MYMHRRNWWIITRCYGYSNRFTTIGHAVKLQSFQPFSSAAEALENANAISEHALSQTLYNFLELNLPNNNNINDQEEEEDGKKKKKKKTKKHSSSGGGPMSSFSLGVLDPALTTAIAENLHISCRSDDTV